MNAHLKLLHFRMINKETNKKIVVAKFISHHIVMFALYARIIVQPIMMSASYDKIISRYIIIFTLYVKII